MADAPLGPIAQHISQLLRRQTSEPSSDGDLLTRFVTGQDQAAFESLVRQHGPMVLGVCRRVLGNEHDAEDACQATFLVLARKASAIRAGTSLGGWLYQVAYRAALKARGQADRRRTEPVEGTDMASSEPTAEVERRELRALLDAELSRLPDKYRTPLVLCYLQGRTTRQVAQSLGWPEGSISKRLDRGRELLRSSLVRRGLTLPAATLAVLLGEKGEAALPESLVQAITGAVGGKAGAVTASVAALADGVLHAMRTARMKTTTALVLALGLMGAGTGLALYGNGAEKQVAVGDTPGLQKQADVAERVDAFGDALPEGARGRLGTIRWRQGSGVVFLAYLPKGQLLTGGADGNFWVWDRDGKELRRFGLGQDEANDPISEKSPYYARKFHAAAVHLAEPMTLATLAANFSARPQSSQIVLWDVTRGTRLHQWEVNGAYFRGLAFTPDGKALVLHDDRFLRRWDVKEGKELPTIGDKPRTDNGIEFGVGVAFSRDGKIVYGHFNDQLTPTVMRWDAATGRLLPVFRGPEDRTDVAFISAGDGKTVAWAHTDGTVAFWDMDTSKKLRAATGARLPIMFTPDSKWLLARDQEEKLCFWDVAEGKRLQQLAGVISPADQSSMLTGNWAFSTDEHYLACGRGPVIRQWETATGKQVGTVAGHQGAITALRLAADGKTVITRGGDDTVRVWNLVGHKEYACLSLPAADFPAALAANGRTLLVHSKGKLTLWDIESRKQIRQWPGHDKGGIGGLALSPDGKVAATRGFDGTLRFWDVAAGKQRLSIPDPLAYERNNRTEEDGLGLGFSADGKMLAVLPPFQRPIANNQETDPVCLLDVASGKQFCKFDRNPTIITSAFSPDGRLLATGDVDDIIALWETATGKECLRIKAAPAGALLALTFSLDGRMLASAGRESTIRFWSASTGQELGRFKGHRGGIPALAFSADGKTLVAGDTDSTVLIHDMAALKIARPPLINLEGQQALALWDDLRGSDAAKAYRAMRTLGAAPTQALPLLRERLQPVPAPDPQRLGQLIASLESQEFAARQKAEDELEKLGELAEPALNKVLAGKPGLETKQRAEKLLGKIASVQTLPPEQLQAMRALAILEDLASPEVRQLLEKLARGAAGARLTREARATLERVTKLQALSGN